MAGNTRVLTTAILLLTLTFELATAQFQEVADIADINQLGCGTLDNLVCPPPTNCLEFGDVCNGQDSCLGGEDERFASLNCEEYGVLCVCVCVCVRL